ncbi:uncharacterized protein LOC120529885 [Polypterus senegalus]|uniref:uncharacterized protein LOC120529885 n=1 Tax=Polypterus senegalus TaxID=55291 RepID=UPI0019664CA5|nr:uncharacterized protein LOC120529885 [Polypterus senegalus]
MGTTTVDCHSRCTALNDLPSPSKSPDGTYGLQTAALCSCFHNGEFKQSTFGLYNPSLLQDALDIKETVIPYALTNTYDVGMFGNPSTISRSILHIYLNVADNNMVSYTLPSNKLLEQEESSFGVLGTESVQFVSYVNPQVLEAVHHFHALPLMHHSGSQRFLGTLEVHHHLFCLADVADQLTQPGCGLPAAQSSLPGGVLPVVQSPASPGQSLLVLFPKSSSSRLVFPSGPKSSNLRCTQQDDDDSQDKRVPEPQFCRPWQWSYRHFDLRSNIC